MKQKRYTQSALLLGGLVLLPSCSDYLETSSPSIVDAEFVFSNTQTARAAMSGAYDAWRECANTKVFGDGLFYASEVCGSDIERHPEFFKNQPGRHYPEGLYQNGTFAGQYSLLSYMKEDDAYASLFNVIGKANAIISAIESMEGFEAMMSADKPGELSQTYGEAVALRATAYRELIRFFGDVPFQDKFGVPAVGLTGRDQIYDILIEQLKEVEPLMYAVGSIPFGSGKNFFSKTYVQGLIGRLGLEGGGYQTRRGDLARVDGKGNALTFENLGTENNGATYGRRSDWRTLVETAKTYLKKAVEEPGSAMWHDIDPRPADKNGRVFDNPYQYFFQQMHNDDAGYADESIYEYPLQQGTGNDPRPYSFGRPSSGGSSKAYPCKSYGQGRINPAFYYGMFDPQDRRRDVSVAVTGSTGKGVETLIPLTPNSKAAGGGLSLNKWDENRQPTPWVAKQRTSGINGPYMRLAEIYLGYAEACALLGDDAEAKTMVARVRERSFPAGQARTDAFIGSKESMLEAVVDERGFEFAGEGDRRWTLIRTGLLPKKIREVKELTKKMIDGLAADGTYTFDNGNVISAYIWTKNVDAKSKYGYRLTAQAPDETDPVLYPSWRGQHDDFGGLGFDYKSDTPETNLAIVGLFSPAADPAALEADGYKKTAWGQDIVDNADEFHKYLFLDYDYQKAPIYLWPFTPNILSTGGFTNGYGFAQK